MTVVTPYKPMHTAFAGSKAAGVQGPAKGLHFKGEEVLDKFDPSTGKKLASYAVSDNKDVDSTMKQAQAAFDTWKDASAKARAKVLLETARLIKDNADELARLISQETGKPLKEAYESDLTTAVNLLSYYAKTGPKALKERKLDLDQSSLLGRKHYERRVPRGVVGVISPWNYPFAIPVSGLAAALMGGNAVVLKPSELTPGVGQKIGELFQTALVHNGFPKEAMQVLIGDGSTGNALIRHEALDYVIFTGSPRTGFKIRETLQQRNVPVSLELGGSDPMIVLKGTKDLDAVASYALWGRFTNAGQTCAAVKRLFVPREHYAEMLSLLKSKMEALSQGNPTDTRNHIGPLISQNQVDEVNAQVQDAVQRGAQIIAGGRPVNGPGFFFEPTLLANVPLDARVLNEEVFGPVLPVVPYDSEEDAVRLANASPFGLTGSVFGPAQQAEKIARQLQVGVVAVNDVGTTNFAFPSVGWQGWKNSGPGVSHGINGLLDTTLTQTVTLNRLFQLSLFRKQPWHFSEAQGDLGFSKALLKQYGDGKKRKMLQPAFLKRLWSNRSQNKI